MAPPILAPAALIASLIAAVFFGAESVVAKRGIEAGGHPKVVSLTVAIVSTVIFGIGAVVLSDLTIFGDQPIFDIGIFFLAGVIGSGLGVLMVYQGVDRVGASVNTAVINSRPLIVALLGFIFLSEALDLMTVGGILIIVAGLVVVSLSHGGDIAGWQLSDLTFSIGAALFFAVGNVLRRYGLTQTEIPLVEGIAVNALGGLVILGIYVIGFHSKALANVSRQSYLWSVATGCCTSSALLAMFFAFERARVAIVDSIIATSPLLSLLLTAIFLRDFERVTRRITVGVVLVVIGTICIVSL